MDRSSPYVFQKALLSSELEEIFAKGIDYPIDKIKLGRLEKPVLRLLYTLGDLLGRNTQILMVAKKTGA